MGMNLDKVRDWEGLGSGKEQTKFGLQNSKIQTIEEEKRRLMILRPRNLKFFK
jgi:hypothetical protein